MVKIFCFVIITAATSAAGNYFSLMLKSRLAALTKLNYMIDEIIMMLRFKSPTVYEIAEELRRDDRFSCFEFLGKISVDKPFRESWRKAVRECPPGGLSESDRALLEDIGMQLGTSDTESQISTLGLQRAELTAAIAAAGADCDKKAKLYRSMGVLAGAFISIMLV